MFPRKRWKIIKTAQQNLYIQFSIVFLGHAPAKDTKIADLSCSMRAQMPQVH